LLKKKCTEIIAEITPLPDLTVIISGTARGADQLGEKFADEMGLEIRRFPADWNQYGKRAGVIRNEQMARYAGEYGNQGVLIAFWDGKSKGTRWMIELAKQYGLKAYVVEF